MAYVYLQHECRSYPCNGKFFYTNVTADDRWRDQEGILIGCIFIIILSMVLVFISNRLFNLFVPGVDTVALCGRRIMQITMPLYWIYVILEILADSLRGIGRSSEPMWILLLTLCGFRTVCLWTLTKLGQQIEFVAAVYPLAWAAAAVSLLFFWIRAMKKVVDGVEK